MLDVQRYIAAAFRLAAIVILLSQAGEIRHGLRPRRNRHGREEEHAQADSHRRCINFLLFLVRNSRSIPATAAPAAAAQICWRNSECKAQSELELARRSLSHRADRDSRVYRTGGGAESVNQDCRVRQPVLRVVENVENLGPELEIHPLG